MVRHIFNEVTKQKEFTYTRGMAKIENKSDTHKGDLEDQARFRSSYQTTDHRATYRMIDQRCHEWGGVKNVGCYN